MLGCIDAAHGVKKCGLCDKLIMTSLAYQCDKCGHYVNVPNCLVDEVRSLYLLGIRVVTARCLRFCDTGYIQVNPGDIKMMEHFGYKHLSASQFGLTTNNERFFVPKTSMPIDFVPEKYEDWEKTNSVSNQNVNEIVAEKDDFDPSNLTALPQESSFKTLEMKLDFSAPVGDVGINLNYEGVYNCELVIAVAEALASMK